MSEAAFQRARHRTVAAALQAMNGAFLAAAECYFAGGTRIVLELGEYRESEDLDFLCSSRAGYRALRSTITDRSLGSILATALPLAREVRADRYGIRTFLDLGASKLKLEIVNEGRIELGGERCATLPVPCIDKPSCFAEKFLANADRGNDAATLARDVIDLAFMLQGWGDAPARDGLARARDAYGAIVEHAARVAAASLLDRKDLMQRCVAALRVTRHKELVAGLTKLAKGAPREAPARKRRAAS
jgi:hypothetical protein